MLDCRNIFRLSALAVLAVAGVSCSRTARITAEIPDAPDSEFVLKQQNVNRYDILDTVKTDASGKFSFKVRMEKGDPDFIYIYRNDRKLASLLVESGDKVHVVSDTLGNYQVSGSPESEKLRQVDYDYRTFSAAMDSLVNLTGTASDAEVSALSSEMARRYTDYYRQCVRYVMENSKSLTVVPVFYQTVANSFYVFSQDTDALHFRNVADSLSSVYPHSKYVRALGQEADKRSRQLEMRVRVQTAEQVGYLDMELPDTQGKKIRLSDVDAKAVLVCFWSPADALQKMSNLDVLKEVYEDYHAKGLEIYQVAIAVDKPSWERIVSAQGLGWINVCDGLGQNSPVVGMYNLSRLPAYFLIVDGQLSDDVITDGKSLRRALQKVL